MFAHRANQTVFSKNYKWQLTVLPRTLQKYPFMDLSTLFHLTLYSLLLIGLNLVLGMQWLEQLGKVTCEWI